MNRNIYLLFALIFAATITKAQIPNSGFETWDNMGGYENPAQWGTMNNTSALVSVYTATKGTPGSPGASYLKLTSLTTTMGVLNGVAVSGVIDTLTMQPVSGFAYNMRPATFTGKWQHMIYGTSQGSVSATLTKWNATTNMRETVATANQTLSGMAMSWAAFSINFTYVSGEDPDSCIIFLKASGAAPTDQDYLWVDNLAFSGTITGIENTNSVMKNVSVFPNPSQNDIVIELNLGSAQKTSIELTDLNGKVVISRTVELPQGNSRQVLDISNLSKGTYLVNLISVNGTEVKKVVIQ